MTDEKLSNLNIDTGSKVQIQDCLDLLKATFLADLKGVYLYGSALLGGLQRYSDIDLFVVLDRSTTRLEKKNIVSGFLEISGFYMKSEKRPLEITIVRQADIVPWRYPPQFDFQYGEWLREDFEAGNLSPWASQDMLDLALLITQALLKSQTLIGIAPDKALPQVPYKDYMRALCDGLPDLMVGLETDTRNVLLTLSRCWYTTSTDEICSKEKAAEWAIDHLPQNYTSIMKRARAICIGEEKERWEDLESLIKLCAEFMLSDIRERLSEILFSDTRKRSIRLSQEEKDLS